MPEHEITHLIGLLALMLVSAKLCGALAQAVGQPAVLGELLAGVVLGGSVLGLVDFHDKILHFLSEVGVVILLVEIGLETELKKLIAVGGSATAVAVVGVVLPYLLGTLVGRLLGLEQMAIVVCAAALTATSVGITARVLTDLNRLHEPESQIILGAAVIDDVIGLVILAIVARLATGGQVTIWGITQTAAIAFGFLIVTLVVGSFIVPPLVKRTGQVKLPGTPTIIGVALAFALAWLAAKCGSAVIIGALAAGLLLRSTLRHEEIQKGVAHLGHFFVPLFFVTIGAEVDLRVLNPLVAANRHTLEVGGLLIVAAIVGKFAAGYAPFWFRGRKAIIGVGMIPRGEVGLIFAQMGLASKALDAGLFSAVALMVMVTTLMAPPLLKLLFPALPAKPDGEPPEGIGSLVTDA